MAERAGFEPAIPFSILAFQASALGHYATSPLCALFDVLSIVKGYNSMDYNRDLSRKATYKDIYNSW
jgi:hypothetical protein